MATIDSKEFVDNIIKHNGFYNGDNEDAPDNPRCVKVVEYINSFGIKTWGVIFENEINRRKYELPTYYVRNPRVIWEYKSNE